MLIILLISVSTILTTVVVAVQRKGSAGIRLNSYSVYSNRVLSKIVGIKLPKHLSRGHSSRDGYELEPFVSAQGRLQPNGTSIDESANSIDKNERAMIEYEWVATVLERFFCLVCVGLLFAISGLTLAIGYNSVE